MKLELVIKNSDGKVIGNYSFIDVHSFNIEQQIGSIKKLTFIEEKVKESE